MPPLQLKQGEDELTASFHASVASTEGNDTTHCVTDASPVSSQQENNAITCVPSTDERDTLDDEEATDDVTIVASNRCKEREIVSLQKQVEQYREKFEALQHEFFQQRLALQREAQLVHNISESNQVLVAELKKASCERDEALRTIEVMDEEKIQQDFKMFVISNERDKLYKGLEESRKERDDARSKLGSMKVERNIMKKTLKKVCKEREELRRQLKKSDRLSDNGENNGDSGFSGTRRGMICNRKAGEADDEALVSTDSDSAVLSQNEC